MTPSSTLCLTREAHHRDRASSTRLDNVRMIETRAADAWAMEALAARTREQRRAKVRAVADAAPGAVKAAADRDRLFSENPDRGFENA